MPEYHLQLSDDDAGGYAFLPGDPGRVSLIAGHLSDAHHVVSNREFTTWTGFLDGTQVSVTSTGIGSPSTAIAVEELCNIGVHTLVRLGSAAAIQPELRCGEVIIANAAVREDGTTALYAPSNVPAVADLDTTVALREGARQLGHPYRVGTVVASDGFWPANQPDRMPQGDLLREHLVAYQRCGVLATDMETAALFMVAQIRGVRAGSILGVVNTLGGTGEMDAHALPMDATIASAIEGMRQLIRSDAAQQASISKISRSA